MTKTPIAGCEWNDAHGSDGTIFPHEIDHKPYVYTTVGYLLRSDTIGVSIASEKGEDGKFRDITFIPRAMVIREFQIHPVPKRSRPRAKKPTPHASLALATPLLSEASDPDHPSESH